MAKWTVQHILNKIYDSTLGALTAKLTTGSAIIGKVGIDQTTPGTTNAVAIDQTTPGTTNLVQIGGSLPAGTAAIGKLAANSGVDIGDVDITSIAAGANIIGKVGIDQTTPGTTNLVQVGGTLPAFAATPTVDTELPAAAALADATANPTIPTVGAANMGYNGATWDRIRTAGGTSDAAAGIGHLHVTLSGYNGSGYDRVRTATIGDAAAVTGVLAGQPFGYNGSTYDRVRNNHTATLFTSAARTVTSSSADQVNYNGQGIIATINVSAIVDTPSVVFTVEAKDPVSAAYTTVLTSAAIVGTGTTRLRVGSNIAAVANLAAADLIGRTWRVTATHADADSITFSNAGETMAA